MLVKFFTTRHFLRLWRTIGFDQLAGFVSSEINFCEAFWENHFGLRSWPRAFVAGLTRSRRVACAGDQSRSCAAAPVAAKAEAGGTFGAANRADAVQPRAVAGDQLDGLHLDCGGADHCHRAAHDLEHEGSAGRRTKRDGGADRRLGEFDGQRAGAESRQMGFPVRDVVFHFHRHFQPDGFVAGRGQHRLGAGRQRQFAAVCD